MSLPACPWCDAEFPTPEERNRHVVTCPKRPAATGRRKSPREPR